MVFPGELRDAMAEEGCPLCRVAGKAVDRFFRWYLLENHYSLPSLLQLANGGFCAPHLAYLERVGGGFLTGAAQFAVRFELERLSGLGKDVEWYSRALPAGVAVSGKAGTAGGEKAGWRRLRRSWVRGLWRRRLRAFRPSGPCPACENYRRSASWAAEVLAGMLDEGAAAGRSAGKVAGEANGQIAGCNDREAYVRSGGLCRRHLFQTLAAASPATVRFLVQDTERRLSAWNNSCDAYFHKEDYRFRHEPRGEEQEAWIRVYRFLVVD